MLLPNDETKANMRRHCMYTATSHELSVVLLCSSCCNVHDMIALLVKAIIICSIYKMTQTAPHVTVAFVTVTVFVSYMK